MQITPFLNLGTATKIGEEFYIVKGEELGNFSLKEQAKIIQNC